MTQAPYNPVRRVQRADEAGIAAMHEKLAGKLKPRVEINGADPGNSQAGEVARSGENDSHREVCQPSVGAAHDGADLASPKSESVETTTAPPRLDWERPEPLSRLIYSVGREYRCRKWSGSQAGTPPDWKYQLERLVENMWFYAMGPICNSFDEVKKIAQTDFDARQEP